MYKYMQVHEKIILNALNETKEEDWVGLGKYHKTQIEFMQHERLIHYYRLENRVQKWYDFYNKIYERNIF